jgi:ABC-2 type transport system ATP-binding protein
MVGLRERARDKVQTYSLGMKQRLGIAAALLSDPRLLLLDEPSNGLDPAGIVAMRETLKGLAASGKTVFVSSHILGEVQQLADVLGIVAAGRLVREGPIEHLLEGEGVIRVRVAATELAAARTVLDGLVPGTTSKLDAEDGWLSLAIQPDRAAEVNRALATAGIYASGLGTGNDLESLFLELTGGDDSSNHEGTFFGAAGSGTAPPARGGPAGPDSTPGGDA